MDKREFRRFDKELEVGYAVTEKSYADELPGRILNISLGGVYMLSGSMIEKETSVKLTFTIKKDEDIKMLSTTGSVLRSGRISDEPEMASRYNIHPSDGMCFAVVKFTAPFIELSFMLH